METFAVPMRFYANWDTIRENNYTIPRALSMILTRLTLFKHLETGAIVISVRLQGNKRTLRSNDIICSIEPGIEIELDISFIIQYGHFIKRKPNILEVLIQRRKKYKNRQIPGFKTLCAGLLNLDEIFQMGGPREVKIYGKTEEINNCYVACLTISQCKSLAVQQTIKSVKNQPKDLNTRDCSEDDEDIAVDESSSDTENEADYLDVDQTPRIPNSVSRKRRSRKKSSQKNIIKQRLAKLLKRFKEPEEENVGISRGETSSGILKPTAKELEEIFQELENISDSGPEIDVDKLSIRSNPRPGLHRPFFGSKTDILPVIDDTAHSEDSESEENSSDLENANFDENCEKKKLSTSVSIETTHQNNVFVAQRIDKIKHSLTARSLNIPSLEIKAVENPPSISEILTRLDSETANPVAANVWICSSADFPWLSRIDFGQLKKARILDCPTSADIRTVVQSIISRIQKFCNSNSISPPPTLIGIYGTDRHISHLLKAYVDLLQNKPAPEWITHLRFALLCPPISALGRLLAQSSDTSQIEASWRSLAKTASVFESGEATSTDLQEFEDVLYNTMNAAANLAENRLLNLPIGEVMLQLNTSLNDSTVQTSSHSINPVPNNHDSNDGSQVFVPFLSEIHLGNLDALNYLYFMKNSMEESQQPQSTALATPGVVSSPNPLSAQAVQQLSSLQHSSTTSPPSSPQLPKTPEATRELHLEYWTYLPLLQNQSSHSQNEFYPFDSGTNLLASGGKSSTVVGNKFSIKATLKTLSIARESTSNLLSIQFVKEKRKDKVLQKLGRKPKAKNAENFVHSRVVANVSRLICSGGKNSDLDLSIDGIIWSKIRFFQVTYQWQTHVKLFPISVPSPPSSGQ